jgi:NADH-quinone oxidoreductase subunit L
MIPYSYIILVPLIPLLAFVVLGLFGRKYFTHSAGLIGTTALLASTVISILIAYSYFFVDGTTGSAYATIRPVQFTWLEFSPGLSIDMGVLLDPISVMMIVVVSFVSLMVHIFSLWYMKGEKRFATYYAFLTLFTFSMLGLVISSNIFQIYIFWELVGVSSFLLIGYYFDRPSAVAASKKAFIVTRFADLGFLIGILILGFYSGTLDFGLLIQRLTDAQSEWFISISSASFLGLSLLTWALVLVFAGGAGKSAMFPLHVWLPDAMEGPTPVSALIHAATMVVAGVFLVARLFPVYAMDETAAGVVTFVGIVSALIAALIACTQTDIKRVLAYSTMSQIGYMMLALGIAAQAADGLGYTASMFHLFTHAFFKSLLFLGAGVVIHHIHSNEMKDMGGLRKAMPLTHLAFLVACLAIAGIPPFSGFFSKEEILLAAWQNNKFVFGLALLTSGLTAFYMFRLYFSIFWKRPLQHSDGHSSEGNLSMKVPLIILTILAFGAGFIPFSKGVTADGIPAATHLDLVFSIAPVVLAIVGILLAAWLYKTENERPEKLAGSLGGMYRFVRHKFYIDEVYLFVTKKILFPLVGRPAAWFDMHIVDGSVNLVASVTRKTSTLIRGFQSGRIQWYALFFFIGIAGLALLFIYVWK